MGRTIFVEVRIPEAETPVTTRRGNLECYNRRNRGFSRSLAQSCSWKIFASTNHDTASPIVPRFSPPASASDGLIRLKSDALPQRWSRL